ncbi:hypothetical protein HanLR1_Chr00c0475g0753261 [Helianthus annuus]|nr:hypothetical protein HanLR1_Chr00c0475g0753261 [Helianthus annuus]
MFELKNEDLEKERHLGTWILKLFGYYDLTFMDFVLSLLRHYVFMHFYDFCEPLVTKFSLNRFLNC